MFLDTSAWTVWMFPEPNVLSHKPVQTALYQLGENFKKVAENQVQSINVFFCIDNVMINANYNKTNIKR